MWADAGRDPVNELYDRGCDLVEAAAAIKRAAAFPEAVSAVPAVLGCIETALAELADASTALEHVAHAATQRPTEDAATARLPTSVAHMRHGLWNLEHGIRDARALAAAARALSARALDRAGIARGSVSAGATPR